MTVAPINTTVEIKRFALADLEPAAYNPRTIGDDAMRGLQESLKDLGVLELPVVNIRDGKRRIVSGHQRVKALLARGVKFSDCVVVRFDDAGEMAANLSLNNPLIRGDFDVRAALPTLEKIADVLPSPSYMGFDLLVADLREQATRLAPLNPTTADDGNAASNAETEPVSQLGKVYVLGQHRLVCDSFERLRKWWKKGEPAKACITDPPYGVAYEQAATGETVENDNLQGEEWHAFLRSACETILCVTEGSCYVFMSSKEIPALQTAWEESGGDVLRWLIWAKDRFTLSRSDYHHMHEPCMFGGRHHNAPDLTDGDALCNVLAFPKPTVNPLHPTQKPVELIRLLMEQSTKVGDLVVDPFAGSGTTLVVAEELGRRCVAAEIEPKHCDTIRKRWAEQVHGAGCDWIKLTPTSKKK